MARSLTPTDLLLVFAPLRLGEQVQGSDEDDIRDFEGARKEAPYEVGLTPSRSAKTLDPPTLRSSLCSTDRPTLARAWWERLSRPLRNFGNQGKPYARVML